MSGGVTGGSKPGVTDLVWALGRPTIGGFTRFVAPLRVYGADRVPREGGVVLALNHFSWLDPPVFGSACPRTIYYMAKIEAHRVPGLGQLIRAFGTFAVRRGESDREAVRLMRRIVRTASRSVSPRRTANVPNARISWPRPGTRWASIFAM